MSPETQAGLGSIVVLFFDLLWWGGLIGVAVLLVVSQRARRAERRPARVALPLPLPPAQAAPTAPTPVEQWPLRVAVALGAAAAVHLVMVRPHLAEGPAHALFFLVVGVAQLVLAALVLLQPTRHLRAVVWSGVGLVAVWAVSRTVGLAGPVEPVGSWDLCVVLWQGYTVLEALRRMPATLPASWRPAVPRAWTAETYGVAALSALALAVLPWSGGHG